MDKALLQWLKNNEGQFFDSPRNEVFGRNPQGFTITSVDLGKKTVRVKFERSKYQALPLYFVMFNRVLEYLRGNISIVYPIGARLQPPYPKESIEGEIWKDPKPRSTEYKSSPHVLDILYYAGYIRFAYTRDRDTGGKVQGAHYITGTPSPVSGSKIKTKSEIKITPVSSIRTVYLDPRRESIQEWVRINKDSIIRNRLNYHWKNRGRKECEKLRNEISKKIIQSRIRNGGALDIDTLNAVIKWGFGRDYPNQNPEKALNLTGKAFEYLDKGDLITATVTLCKENGVGISRASKIIGLFDQENLCIYDSRVGVALRTLTYEGERMIKIPPGYNRECDLNVSNEEFAQNYQWLIWVCEEIREYLNLNGCTYRLADVEMALFMMGK